MSFYEKCFFSPLCDLTDLCRDPLGRRCLHLAKVRLQHNPHRISPQWRHQMNWKSSNAFDQIRANYYQEVDEDVLVEGH